MNKQRIIAILKKEFAQLFKDKKLLPIVFVAPVLQLIFLGYAASLDIKNISVVLCDLDKSSASRELVGRFAHSGYFSIDYSTEDYQNIGSYLDANKASMVLVIPSSFHEKLARRESAKLQILLDGSEGSTSATTMTYVNQVIARYSTSILVELIGHPQSLGGINAQIRTWFNPSLRSRNYMVPAVLVLILLVTTTVLSSMAIVKEKEIGTLEQIMVTPIRSSELILGKLIPFTFIGAMNVTVVLTVMVFGFGIAIKGSVLLIAFLSTIFLMTTLGLGLFISTVSKTQQQAMMTAMFFLLMPMMFLSGFAFPVENMPKILQMISMFIPLRHFLVIVRSIILKGVGLHELWLQAIILLVMGGGILILSMLRFKKKLE